MAQIVLVGLGAGAASALLFASVSSGALLATFLFYLAPLPLLIAALGWSHWAGIVAGIVAAASLASVLGFHFFIVFLIGVAVPAWWLAYLSLLARPAAVNGSADLEWYPIGRLVLWAALISAFVVILAVPDFGTDKESFQAGLRSAFEQAIGIDPQVNPSGSVTGAEGDRLIRIMVSAIPPAAAILGTVISIGNLWLAGRVVLISGRLRRPWPQLSGLSFPTFAPGLAGAALAGSFLPDLAGLVSEIVAASLLTAYAILGFAVLHAITRGVSNRGLALAGTYAAVVVLGWPVIAISLLGLADSAFNIRARVLRRTGPPDVRN
ncbi:MAG TPA: DUF2232 domain-containing protein [Xanthobacteraceae bacterium]|jgi:hypothetical protein